MVWYYSVLLHTVILESKNLVFIQVQKENLEQIVFTTAEAADYLRLKKVTLEVWRRNDRVKLPYCKIGRAVRYRKEALDEFLKIQEKNLEILPGRA